MPCKAANVDKVCVASRLHRYDGSPSGRPRAVPHSKVFTLARPLPPAAAEALGASHSLGYCLMGSHNISKFAWGELQKGGSQLAIRSFELGVLLLPSLEAAYRAHPHRAFVADEEEEEDKGDRKKGEEEEEAIWWPEAPSVRFVPCTVDTALQPPKSHGGTLYVPLPIPFKASRLSAFAARLRL